MFFLMEHMLREFNLFEHFAIDAKKLAFALRPPAEPRSLHSDSPPRNDPPRDNPFFNLCGHNCVENHLWLRHSHLYAHWRVLQRRASVSSGADHNGQRWRQERRRHGRLEATRAPTPMTTSSGISGSMARSAW